MEGQIFFYIIGYFLVINAATYLVFGWDKWSASKKGHRIRERTLLIMMLIGGSVGGVMGMNMFRHKTQKIEFQTIVTVIVLIQIITILALSFYFN